MVKLDKFCYYTPIKVLVLSLVISFIVAIVGSIIQPSHPTQHGEGSIGGLWVGLLCTLSTIIYSILSYTIVLNFYDTVRSNIYLCFLSFYFPVIIVLLGILITEGFEPGLIVIITSIPFLIPQSYYFVRFRKRLATGEILEDFYVDSYSDENN